MIWCSTLKIQSDKELIMFNSSETVLLQYEHNDTMCYKLIEAHAPLNGVLPYMLFHSLESVQSYCQKRNLAILDQMLFF